LGSFSFTMLQALGALSTLPISPCRSGLFRSLCGLKIASPPTTDDDSGSWKKRPHGTRLDRSDLPSRAPKPPRRVRRSEVWLAAARLAALAVAHRSSQRIRARWNPDRPPKRFEPADSVAFALQCFGIRRDVIAEVIASAPHLINAATAWNNVGQLAWLEEGPALTRR
jgi:hypothetical protein